MRRSSIGYLFYSCFTRQLYSAANASGTVLEHILEQDGCDVDLQNRIEKYTPLHLAVRISEPDERIAIGKPDAAGTRRRAPF